MELTLTIIFSNGTLVTFIILGMSKLEIQINFGEQADHNVVEHHLVILHYFQFDQCIQ